MIVGVAVLRAKFLEETMGGRIKPAAIVCGLIATICTVAPGGSFAQAQAPQVQAAPVYPATDAGFNAQMSAVLDAYQGGDKATGQRLIEQFRLPRPQDWFAEKFGPEQAEALTRRYNRLADGYTNYADRLWNELAANKARRVDLSLTPATKEPPPVATAPAPAPADESPAASSSDELPVNRKPSGLVPVIQPECFNAHFKFKLTSRTQTVVTGVFRAESWEDTFVYQDGAFRFVGHGAWPFWAWDESVRENAAPVNLPTPLELNTETVDEMVPYSIDKVTAALKPAMESKACKVKQETPGRIECKRTHERGYGGESVTALLDAQGDQTHIHITTGKGFYGRLGKVNWSVPIYREMLSKLHASQP